MARGGFRAGSGRKRRNVSIDAQTDAFANAVSTPVTNEQKPGKRGGRSPLKLLLDVMADETLPLDTRMKAAFTALPYTHRKPVEMGKKEQQHKAAEVASRDGGRFAPSPPPKALPFWKKSS